MEKDVVQSDTKRLLLEKCLRGEFVLAGSGDSPTEEARPQPAPPSHGKELEAHPAQQPEQSIRSSANDSAKLQHSVNIKTNRKSVARRTLNRILHLLCRFGPGGYTLRPFLHRVRGVRIGKNVWIGDDVYLDNEWPECIELHDGAMLELRATVIAHTHGAGKVIIGKNAFVGAGSMIVAATKHTVVIGEGAVVMASSLVNSSVAPYTLYGSDSSRPLAKVTKPFTATTSYEEFIATLRSLSD